MDRLERRYRANNLTRERWEKNYPRFRLSSVSWYEERTPIGFFKKRKGYPWYAGGCCPKCNKRRKSEYRRDLKSKWYKEKKDIIQRYGHLGRTTGTTQPD